MTCRGKASEERIQSSNHHVFHRSVLRAWPMVALCQTFGHEGQLYHPDNGSVLALCSGCIGSLLGNGGVTCSQPRDAQKTLRRLEMTEQRRREIQNFIECGNATDQAPSILDAEFPETVWRWGTQVIKTTWLRGIHPGSSFLVFDSEESAVAANAPAPTEVQFYDAIACAFNMGKSLLIVVDGKWNEIARYPTR